MKQSNKNPNVGPAPQTVVEIRGLTKRFDDRLAVDELDLDISAGECLGLLGPNGAGKTTTIHMILGLVRPSGGSIRIFGESIAKRLGAVKKRIGVSPQSDNLDPDLTVTENLMTYASYYGVRREQALKKADELLRFFALSRRKDDIISHLSGGQRRRLLLARALIHSPDLLFLDEPTIGLDPQARHLIWERLDALRERGTTMLLTSHYMEEVSRLAGRVLILDHGRIVARGKPQEMVREMVGNDVYEFEEIPEDLRVLEAQLKPCEVTLERTADRLFVYSSKHCSELDALALSRHRVIKRPANLEDLFLKLTGRKLRES